MRADQMSECGANDVVRRPVEGHRATAALRQILAVEQSSTTPRNERQLLAHSGTNLNALVRGVAMAVGRYRVLESSTLDLIGPAGDSHGTSRSWDGTEVDAGTRRAHHGCLSHKYSIASACRQPAFGQSAATQAHADGNGIRARVPQSAHILAPPLASTTEVAPQGEAPLRGVE